ncbi:MAG: flagellar export chaperone FliS [Verrucomicrobiales bacterium]|nr:flagellar export chaperone FliS [Verrucomicrobiales bacterium]|tara:strand:- start:1358 stop:1867 length:510 start_codon:yes stop_codon:yes gene_type:complete
MNPYNRPQAGAPIPSDGPANPYAKVNAYQSTSVNTSSPSDLVLMLYDGIIRFLNNAKGGFDLEDPADFHQVINGNIQKAQAIIRELRSSLDMDKATEFGETMAGLYDYFDRRLQEANMDKKPDPIDEVIGRVQTIRDAWEEMVRRELKNVSSKEEGGESTEVGTLDISG